MTTNWLAERLSLTGFLLQLSQAGRLTDERRSFAKCQCLGHMAPPSRFAGPLQIQIAVLASCRSETSA